MFVHVRSVLEPSDTYVKKSFSISPIRPKLFKWCPWTSQIARRRHAFPFMPSAVSMSSAVP